MPQLKYHDGSNWQPIMQQLGDYSVSIKGETLTGAIDGTNKTYTVSRQFQLKTAPDSHSIAIYLNKQRQIQGVDYNIDANRNIVFVTAPASGSSLIADYDTTTSYSITGSSNFVFKGPVAGTKDGSNKTFQTQTIYLPGTLQVYLNGQMQGGLITETFPNAGQFQFDQAPLSTDSIEVSYQGALTQSGNADTVDGFHASATPQANTLIALNSSGLIPAVLPISRQNDTTNNQTPGARIETGWGVITNSTSNNTVSEPVTFRNAFTSPPIVIATCGGDSSSSQTYGSGGLNLAAGIVSQTSNITTNGFQITMGKRDSVNMSTGYTFYQWVAIGV